MFFDPAGLVPCELECEVKDPNSLQNGDDDGRFSIISGLTASLELLRYEKEAPKRKHGSTVFRPMTNKNGSLEYQNCLRKHCDIDSIIVVHFFAAMVYMYIDPVKIQALPGPLLFPKRLRHSFICAGVVKPSLFSPNGSVDDQYHQQSQMTYLTA
ncbi:uncharacterized protein PHALS_01513 [Plasmopara halstedii]|uniref:Uncharacterized protein n=1 Tax=Plasmopara halstedii TaxID=4781 RepID=A0A0P1AU21_PLAHL|nr:uncharacterized protein PHALS_01513 [Plasmopara halstedii]CEG45198.1 hypothetical protein PHALS_01513 [Plasmopara halstedii]|eukprot:XP_024581567.1 hypothetical protein PHALS_01513 [Plasmopara halstedii]